MDGQKELIKPDLDENGLNVLRRRYLKKDEKGKVVETPEQLFQRVAHDIAKANETYGDRSVEEDEKDFYEIMANRSFMPNSPTLMNAGTSLQQLSACFVIPIEDNMDSIFQGVKDTAMIHKTGGGTGFSFSRLRPVDDIISTTGEKSSGPISFMNVYNAATEQVKQGGKRRGANMGILSVDHPDIMDFITSKDSEKELNNFNISVAATNKFMESLKKGKDFKLINPKDGKIIQRIDPKEIFDLATKMAWKNGEPGMIFLDNINKDNPTPHLGEIESTNPCGEQPLLPYESCNLGSINLSRMVKDGRVDWKKLEDVVKKAVRFLDNVIDRNAYPLEKIKEMTKNNRKIGLGVMGFADMLIKLKIPYDSEKGLEIAEKVMKFISEKAKQESVEIARSRGVFPNFKGSIYDTGRKQDRVRNATRTTIAPTGTIGIITGCSSGIEPLYAIAYTRNVKNSLGEDIINTNPYFEEIAKDKNFYSEELLKKIVKKGTAKVDEVPEDIQKLFSTAHDITPEWHVKMQAAFQKYVDNAVSKTVNFKNSATKEDVANTYKLAYDLGCKGITIYRDGSREEQILTTGIKEEPISQEKRKIKKPRERPKIIRGTTQKIQTGCGGLYVTINEDKNGLFEVFAQMGKSGGCITSFSESLARMVSLALRSGISTKEILDQLGSIRCPRPSWETGGRIYSCSDAIAKAIKNYIKGEANVSQERVEEFIGKKSGKDNAVKNGVSPECPECGGMVDFVEGCVVCRSCGYSEC